jgi:6-phosphogluconate dehydrogenase
MQIGMIGLGLMSGNMARRPTKGGHQCVVFDRNRENVNALAKEGPAPAYSLEELVETNGSPHAAEADYQDRLLSAIRFGFGGHLEKAAKRL